jgi:hypothetical protein
VLKCLKAVFIVHGLIGEILITLRKFLEFLSEEQDIEAIFKIIEIHTFEQVIFNGLLNICYDKKSRTEFELYVKSKLNDVSYLAPLPFYGKKINQINYP